MVKHSPGSLDATFAALSDPTRRAIVERLAAVGEASVSELAAPFDMSLPAVTKHLDALEHAGVVRRRKQGRTRYCRLEWRPVSDIGDWVARHERFWQQQLDSLADYVAQREDEH